MNTKHINLIHTPIHTFFETYFLTEISPKMFLCKCPMFCNVVPLVLRKEIDIIKQCYTVVVKLSSSGLSAFLA